MTTQWDRVADTLVNYSAKVQPRERVMIAMTELHAYPLTLAVYEATLKAGAFPQVQLLSAEMKDAVLRLGDEQQVSWAPEIEQYGMEWADVYFGLRGSSNLYQHDGVPAQVLAKQQRAMGTVSASRWEKTRWCLVRVPSEAMAVAARTSHSRLLDMFFRSATLDWEECASKWQETADLLEKAAEIRLVDESSKTDISFSAVGRKWVVFAGEKNLPDGEIATAPLVETVNGTFGFNLPGVFGGRIIEDIRLSWRDGHLHDATSSTNQDFLRAVLETDEGATAMGEFGIGVNPLIDRFSYDILYDEKMVGTVHAALGRAYPECGGTNQSSLHWDIIHDMRNGGLLLADGVPVPLAVLPTT